MDAQFYALSPDAQTELQILCWFSEEPIPLRLLRIERSDEVVKAELTQGQYADYHPENDTIVLKPGISARLQQFADEHYRSFLSRFFEWMVSIGRYRRLPRKKFWCLRNALDRVGKLLQSVEGSAWSSEQLRWLTSHARSLGEAAVQRKVGWPTSHVMNKMALMQGSLEKPSIAVSFARLSLKSSELENGPNHAETGTVLFNLGMLVSKTGIVSDAEEHLRRAWPILAKAYGAQHESIGRLLEELGAICLVLKKSHEAEELLEEALRIQKQNHGMANPTGARRLRKLAQARRASGKTEEAETLLEQARDIFMESKGANDVEVAEIWLEMGYLYSHSKRSREAVGAFGKAENIFLVALGPEHSSTRWASGMRLAEEQDVATGAGTGRKVPEAGA